MHCNPSIMWFYISWMISRTISSMSSATKQAMTENNDACKKWSGCKEPSSAISCYNWNRARLSGLACWDCSFVLTSICFVLFLVLFLTLLFCWLLNCALLIHSSDFSQLLHCTRFYQGGIISISPIFPDSGCRRILFSEALLSWLRSMLS